MSGGEQDKSSGAVPLRREQVLDELEYLASVEHALCVEYLSVYCALGLDLPPAENGTSVQRVRNAADAAFALALSEMSHLRRVNRGLTLAGRPPQVGRATGIGGDSVAAIALGPPSRAQLEALLDREQAIASAVDERYVRLRPAIGPQDPVFEGEALEQMTFILDTCSDHLAAVATLRDLLEGLAPGEFLRATCREATDDLERSLLELSDHYYGLIVATIHTWFAHEKQLSGLRDRAVSTMDGLNEINRLLVERGLLPAFTLPTIVSGLTPHA
jgi:hypothetical protein